MQKFGFLLLDSICKLISTGNFVKSPNRRSEQNRGAAATAVLMAETVTSIQKVRDYITKYGIEEKLSEAVNQAIKQESTDPFRVISMYLAQFAEVPRVALPLALLDIAFSPHDRAHILARRLQMGRWQMQRPQQMRRSLRRMHRRPSQMHRRLRRLPSHEARCSVPIGESVSS